MKGGYMKGFLLAALLLFTLYGYADAAILVMSTNGTYTTKTTLEVARTAADVAGKTVVVTSALTEAQSNITAAWPADRALKVEKGGSITNSTTFPINGPFEAGLYQVFAGSGSVTGLKESTAEMFGAKGDNSTDDSTATQKAVASLVSNGKLKLDVNKIYRVANVSLTRSINIDLNGSTLKSIPYANGVSKRIFYAATSDAVPHIIIKNGKLDGAGTTRGTGVDEMYPLIQLDTVGTVVLKDLEIFNHAAGINSIPTPLKDRLIGCVVVRYPSKMVTMDNITLHDNWNEQLWVYNGPASGNYTEVLNCKSYNGQVNPANSPITVTGGSLKISGCRFLETNGSVINVQKTSSAEIVNNTIIGESGDGYGVNISHDGELGYTDNVLISGNYIEGTFRGGISVAGGSHNKITNNTFINPGGYGISCRANYKKTESDAHLPDYPETTHNSYSDLIISGNTITDVTYSETTNGVGVFVENNDSGYIWSDVTIIDNYIQQPGLNATKVLKNGMVLGNLVRATIRSNSIYDATYNSIRIDGSVDTLQIVDNVFTPTTYDSQENHAILFYAPALTCANITIEQNIFNGFYTAGSVNINFFGGVFSNIKIINNKGILAGISGASGLFLYRKDDYPMQASIPTTGTYYLYDTVPATPAASSVEGWVVVDNRGTLGTLNGGATRGDIAIGSNILTVNSSTGMSVGQIISVVGAVSTGTGAIIQNINGTTITLSENATGTTTGLTAVVNFVTPTFKTKGVTGA